MQYDHQAIVPYFPFCQETSRLVDAATARAEEQGAVRDALEALDVLVTTLTSQTHGREKITALEPEPIPSNPSQAQGQLGQATRARRAAQQRYSRSIAMPAERGVRCHAS